MQSDGGEAFYAYTNLLYEMYVMLENGGNQQYEAPLSCISEEKIASCNRALNIFNLSFQLRLQFYDFCYNVQQKTIQSDNKIYFNLETNITYKKKQQMRETFNNTKTG